MKNTLKILLAKVLFIGLVLFIVAGCEKESESEKEQAAIKAYLEENNITTEPQYSGLYYIEVLAGSGASADGGDKVQVRYKGTFLNGEEFDSGVFTFTLGIGSVIRGWDEGISYMKEGGKAILLVPSELGYGSNGYGSIPGYTPLLFEVELLDVY